ncbi:MAG: putative integrase [Sulfolobaceae archaeon]
MAIIILGDKMGEKQRHYKFGDYILREKGRYFVHELENVNGETKERYVGSLADVVESYQKRKIIALGC